MAYTAGFSVNVGDPTKASNITTLAANDDFLKAAVDAIMTDSATPSASIKSTVVLANGVTATTQSSGDNSTKVATTAYADAQGISFTNDANNRVVTGTGSGINGEANLTFDGTDLAMYKDSNNGDQKFSIGTSASEAFFLESDIGTSDKLLKSIIFRTETSGSTSTASNGAYKFFVNRNDYTSDPAMVEINYHQLIVGLADEFTFDFGQLTCASGSNNAVYVNTTVTKKIAVQDPDDSAVIWMEGATERATITWDASEDYLKIDNLEESTALSIGPTIAVTGNFTATGNIETLSDKRFKKDVSPIVNSLDKIDKLVGVSYTKKDSEEKNIGLIAQDIEKIIPEVVSTSEAGIKSLAYGNLTALLIEGIKDLNQRIKSLEEKCKCRS